MSKNTLYNFIKNFVYTGKGKKLSFKNSNLLPATTRDNKSYFRFDFQTPQPIKLTDGELELILTGHHISVYHDQKDNNPVLSQYHYTADFSGSDGKNYNLHTYFNSNDELAAPPKLAVETNGEFAPVDSKAFQEQFLNLALLNTQTVLTELRKRQHHTITNLENSINKREEEAAALSQNLQDNYDEWQETTDKILDEINQVHPLVAHKNYKKMYHITAMLKTQLTVKHIARSEVSPTALPESQDETAPRASHGKKSSRKSKKRSTNINLDAAVDALGLRFANMDRENLEAFTAEINEIHTDFYQISLLLDEPGKSKMLSITSLKQLQHLEIEIKNTGKKLLLALMETGRFDLAAQLSRYHYVLNARHLNKALINRNTELLDFLLTYGNYSINNQPITMGEQTYSSPVNCCVQAYSKKKNTAACLSVLIKHNASILIPGKNGLPLAHIILSTVDHPLKSALTDNEDKTLHNAQFYKQLVAAIEHYLRMVDEAERASLHNSIEQYNTEIIQINATAQYAGSRTSEVLHQVEDANNHIKGDIFQKITSHPDFQELKRKITIASKQYTGKLTRLKKHQETSSVIEEFKQLKEMDNTFFQNPDKEVLESITPRTLQALQTRLDIINKKSELLDVQQLILSSRKGTKITKEQRFLQAQQSELMQEIASLQESVQLPGTMASLQKLISNRQMLADFTQVLKQKIAEKEGKETSPSSAEKEKPDSFFYSGAKLESMLGDMEKNIDSYHNP